MDDADQKVYDWRAPVASMYYDYEKGAASYQALDKIYDGTILEKKQFDISNGKFHNAVDTDERVNDTDFAERTWKEQRYEDEIRRCDHSKKNRMI